MKIRNASFEELTVLRDMFMAHITAHPEYISHGEMQMGVGVADFAAGGAERVLVARPAPDGGERWMKYIKEKFASEDAAIFVAELSAADGLSGAFAEAGTGESCGRSGAVGADIVGFTVVEITDDGADPFGVLCDILVHEYGRGQGIGGALLEAAFSWLRSRGIRDVYLESGKDNAPAHEFFRRRSFVHVSEIYRLSTEL